MTSDGKLARAPRSRHYMFGGGPVAAPSLPGGLYLVATPIGNLGDISLRALETLAAADVIACEDSRVTRKLIEHYGIATQLTPYHEHNAAEARPRLLTRLADGQSVALVSDAGTPLISDPGYKLVRAACAAGHAVTAVPGASAVLTALSAAGLPTDRFFFEGFLPPSQAARQRRIAALVSIPASLVLFESGPLDELARHYAAGGETRGEIVIVVAPPRGGGKNADDIDELLRRALARVSVKDAVGEVAFATGRPRREVYQRALALTKDGDHGLPS